jgi:hypothetical protein
MASLITTKKECNNICQIECQNIEGISRIDITHHSLSPLPHQSTQKSNLLILILQQLFQYRLINIVKLASGIHASAVIMGSKSIVVNIMPQGYDILLLHFQRLRNIRQLAKVYISIAPLNAAVSAHTQSCFIGHPFLGKVLVFPYRRIFWPTCSISLKFY